MSFYYKLWITVLLLEVGCSNNKPIQVNMVITEIHLTLSSESKQIDTRYYDKLNVVFRNQIAKHSDLQYT